MDPTYNGMLCNLLATTLPTPNFNSSTNLHTSGCHSKQATMSTAHPLTYYVPHVSSTPKLQNTSSNAPTLTACKSGMASIKAYKSYALNRISHNQYRTFSLLVSGLDETMNQPSHTIQQHNLNYYPSSNNK